MYISINKNDKQKRLSCLVLLVWSAAENQSDNMRLILQAHRFAMPSVNSHPNQNLEQYAIDLNMHHT